jgi:hypothetical protein
MRKTIKSHLHLTTRFRKEVKTSAVERNNSSASAEPSFAKTRLSY